MINGRLSALNDKVMLFEKVWDPVIFGKMSSVIVGLNVHTAYIYCVCGEKGKMCQNCGKFAARFPVLNVILHVQKMEIEVHLITAVSKLCSKPMCT